ncbi:MAG: B12-binding domain-containing radical SAM protein [Nitrospinae bacterium]|nr:B12-binding domain-containing radical SAM protein [Nitrospinota bacterium]
MKLTLVYPTFGMEKNPVQPFGILYVAAALQKADFEVSIIDTSLFSGFDEFEQALSREKPDVLGFTIPTWLLNNSYKAIKIARRVMPRIPIIVGGPHPTIQAEEMLESFGADVACIGEGEITTVELCEALKNKTDLQRVKGIVYRDGDRFIRTPPREKVKDLDTLAWPARDLLNISAYLQQPPNPPELYPLLGILASRGCPFSCTFCADTLHELFGKSIRYRSPKDVVDEMEFITHKYKLRGIRIVDDEFTANNKWVMKFCDEMIRRKVKVSWSCNSRVDTVSEELIQKMKEAGCSYIIFGVESGSQQILDSLRKEIKVEEIKRAFAICNKYGLPTRCNLMVGSPGETMDTFNETKRLLSDIEPDFIIVGITSPIPGTELYDQAKAKGITIAKSDSSIDRFQSLLILENFTHQETVGLVKNLFHHYFKIVASYLYNPVQLFKKRHFFKAIFRYFYNMFAQNPRLCLSTVLHLVNYQKVRFGNALTVANVVEEQRKFIC